MYESNNCLKNDYARNLETGLRSQLLDILRHGKQYDVAMIQYEERVITDASGHEIIDFASGNYLGFDKAVDQLLPKALEAVERYGLHLGRARLTGHNALCSDMEKKLAARVNAGDTLLLTNTTLGSIGLIPAIIEKDDLIIIDKSAHATIFQGCQLARDKGATLVSYPQKDLNRLEDLLKQYESARHKLICIDGVYSITGDYADLPAINQLAKHHNALIYIDDAHGFGFIGEQPDDLHPYGLRGSGIVQYYGLDYDNILYTAGTAKNLSAACAFAVVTPAMKEVLLACAKPFDYTQQPIPFSLGVLNGALDLLDQEGDQRRQQVYQLRQQLVGGLQTLGYHLLTRTDFPIVSVWVGDYQTLLDSSTFLYDQGIYMTSCPYPTMPRGQECIRITLTALNTPRQIDRLLSAFAELSERWQIRGKSLQPEKSSP